MRKCLWCPACRDEGLHELQAIGITGIIREHPAGAAQHEFRLVSILATKYRLRSRSPGSGRRDTASSQRATSCSRPAAADASAQAEPWWLAGPAGIRSMGRSASSGLRSSR